MSNAELLLQTIDRIWPDWVSNAQLRSRTGIEPHQQVFQLTRNLTNNGRIEGERRGKEWFFRAVRDPQHPVEVASLKKRASPGVPGPSNPPRDFESTARAILSSLSGVPLEPGRLANVPKTFDLVSADGKIVGDAKFFDLVRGQHTPPAKFSIIAEHVWLLEKTEAQCRFLVFGNNRSVPVQWLKKYGALVQNVVFLFLDQEGGVEVLADALGDFSSYVQPCPESACRMAPGGPPNRGQ